MYLISQTEAACEFEVTKQYINNLIRNGKIKRYENKQVDYYEIQDFMDRESKQDYILDEDKKELLRNKLLKQKHFISWELEDITKDKFIDFLLDNFYFYFKDINDEQEVIKSLSSISHLIYYYQYGYEQKPYIDAKKEFDNKVSNDKTKVKKIVKELLEILNHSYNEEFIKTIKEMEEHPYRFIKNPEYIPEYQLTKKYISSHIQMITSNKSQSLRYKKIINKKDNTRKTEIIYPHTYEINKILEQLPFN